VTKTGDVDSTTDPEPVEEVAPVPPLATGNTPDTLPVKLTKPNVGAAPTPLDVSTNPEVEGDIPVNALVPLPIKIWYWVIDVVPVPPLATDNAELRLKEPSNNRFPSSLVLPTFQNP
jgi:hypothetical protein